MWFYISLVFLPGICQFYFEGCRERNGWRNWRVSEKIVYYAYAVLLILIVGLRHKVGGDWDAYMVQLFAQKDEPITTAIFLGDPAYEILDWIGINSGLGIYFVNTVCAILFIYGLASFSVRQPFPWLAVVSAMPYLVIVVSMGYTRQGVAIGLSMLALVALEDRRLIKFILWIAIASMFHKTALILIPLALVVRSRRPILLWISVILVMIFLFSLFVSDSLDLMLHGYIEAKVESAGAVTRVAIGAFFAIIFLTNNKRFGLGEAGNDLWKVISYVNIILIFLLYMTPSTTVVDRFGLYLFPLQVFVLSRIPILFNGNIYFFRAVELLVISYALSVTLFWFFYSNYAKYWLPYNFYPFIDIIFNN